MIIQSTEGNKVPGSCGIPAEVWKQCGLWLQGKQHDFIVHTCKFELAHINWQDANMVPILKKLQHEGML